MTPLPRPAGTRPAVARTPRPAALPMAALVTLVTLLGGCAAADLTDAPSWDVALNFPVKGTSLPVATLLPTRVALRPDSSVFDVTVDGTTATRTLGAVCPACNALNGTTAPRPALSFTTSGGTVLPSDLVSATVAGGNLLLTILNGFTFDPLGGSPAAALVITVTDGANRVVARDSLSGASFAIPARRPTQRTIPLTPGAIRGPLTVTTAITSPVGGPAAINIDEAFTVLGTVQNLAVSDATVNVTAKAVTTGASAFDLSGLDEGIRDRLLGGSLRLVVTNPFGVTGTLTLTLTGGGVTITKPLALAAGASSPSLTFSQQEMRSMVGRNLTLTLAGPVSATTPVRIAPRDRASVSARLELSLSTEPR